MQAATQEKLCQLLDVSDMDVDTSDVGTTCDKCKDFDKLINLLVEKCKISSRRHKIQILTLVPDSWSKHKVQETFGVSEYMVRRARQLRKRKVYLLSQKRNLVILFQ
jgi:hypothetical protein